MANWNRSTWTDAGQITALLDPVEPQAEARGQPLHAWYERLVEAGELDEALNFMAQAMSRYDCVVWATRAAIAIGAVDRGDPLAVAVLRWIDNPDDELRRAAGEAAEQVLADTPAKLLCLAVLLSGGSLAPEDLPAVQPPPEVCARLAAAALLVGAHKLADPARAKQQALEFGETMVSA